MNAARVSRCSGTAKLRSRMGVPASRQLRRSRAGNTLRDKSCRASQPSASSSAAHTTRAAKAAQPSSRREPSSKPRPRIEKIMENLLCFFTTHIMIAYSAARGKERKAKTHFDKKCANFSKRGLDSAAVPRYTLGQKVRFRAGCNSPLAVKSATTRKGADPVQLRDQRYSPDARNGRQIVVYAPCCSVFVAAGRFSICPSRSKKQDTKRAFGTIFVRGILPREGSLP